MNDLAILVIIGGAVLLLLGFYRRRKQYAHNLRALALGVVIGGIVYGLSQSEVVGILAGVIVVLLQPKRSRYISARDRRIKRAEFELSGERYNSKKHHLDHKVPFSRGGSNTADNLQVVDKRENLQKGNRAPWWGR